MSSSPVYCKLKNTCRIYDRNWDEQDIFDTSTENTLLCCTMCMQTARRVTHRDRDFTKCTLQRKFVRPACVLSLLCCHPHPCLQRTLDLTFGVILLLQHLGAYPCIWQGGSVPPALSHLSPIAAELGVACVVVQAACSPPSPLCCADRRCPSAAAPLGRGARAPFG